MTSSYFEVWKKKMENNGGSIVQARINDSKGFINRSFVDDPSYKLAKLRKKDIGIVDSDLDTRIVNNEQNPLEKKIYARPDTSIEVGDYIVYPNITYLVLAVETNLISPRADSTKCNQLLKWMYKNNLYSTQAIVINQTKYTLGMEVLVSGISESDSRFQVKLPYNDITKNIAIGQRFIFYDGAWKVTQTDRVSDGGLLNLLLGQDSINDEIDDRVGEIAGFYANKHTYTYDIQPNINVEKSNSINLVYSIKDETGKEFDYSLVTVKNNSNLIQVDNNKGVISIKGLDIGIGTITLSVPSGEISKEFTINFEVKAVVADKIDYKVTTSNGYTYRVKEGSQISAIRYINGIADDTLQIDYTISQLGQDLLSKGSISLVKKTQNSLQIRNEKINTSMTFTLTIVDKDTGDKILDNQVITLKGM